MALKPRTVMINVSQPLPDEEHFFVYDGDDFVAQFYLLEARGHGQIWAVSGTVPPFAANCDDFESYDDALRFIISHR